ncbi:hypothetical protein PUN28_011115 [Cardiocondyla obscurior]|uniref:Uncharacterized protein n=1 Tax=Cardiocondyla obscurior TaxID=286306 RepID=A0AAW2FLR8_9HYME
MKSSKLIVYSLQLNYLQQFESLYFRPAKGFVPTNNRKFQEIFIPIKRFQNNFSEQRSTVHTVIRALS